MSFYRQQKSRIKESFGIKDFEAQFIHIRIKRFWRRRSRHFIWGNGMTASSFSHLQQKGSFYFSKDFQYSGISYFGNTLVLLCYLFPYTTLPSCLFTFSHWSLLLKRACVLSGCCKACAYIKTAFFLFERFVFKSKTFLPVVQNVLGFDHYWTPCRFLKQQDKCLCSCSRKVCLLCYMWVLLVFPIYISTI